MQESRRFSASAESVAAARRFVAELAHQWDLGDLEWPLVQIVSELASNAIIHAGTDFTVCLAREGDASRIEVVDASARGALPRAYGLDATTGRGLLLVERLSREWGVSKTKEGKAVWAVVDAAGLEDRNPDALIDSFLDPAGDGEQPVHGAGESATARGGSPPSAHLPQAA